MKVLTVKTIETISPDIQRDIHYTLRMEHQTDYVFRDMEDAQYSATITLEDPAETIEVIVKNSALLPEFTLVIDILDMEANRIDRMIVREGVVKERKSGSWEWDGEC